MKRFVLFGASGLLGHVWLDWLESQEGVEVVSVGRTAPSGTRPPNATHVTVDLANPSKAVERVAALKPYAILHLASYPPKEFEEDPEKGATMVSAMATTLAEAAAMCRAKAVLVSCDRVFDGHGTMSEEATPEPVSAIAKALRAAEEIVETRCDDRLILRTSMLFGFAPERRETLVSRWVPRWYQDEVVTVPVDVVGSPTWVRALPRIGHALMRQDGVFHVGGPERLSLYDLAMRMASALDVPADKVRGMAAHDNPAPYGPPCDGGLMSDRYQAFVGGMASLDAILVDVARQVRRNTALKP